MRTIHRAASTQLLSFVLLLGSVIGLAACGHTEAAPPTIPMDVVMQAIRDYGRGHQAIPVPTPPEKPDETDGMYCAHIRSLLLQEDFAQLETIARQNRLEKGRLLGGMWKTSSFYTAASYTSCTQAGTEAEYLSQMALLKKWTAAYPDSVTPRLALAALYVDYAWLARGSGTADTVTGKGWRLFRERIAQVKDILIHAGSLKEKDPQWYSLMQDVAKDEGWDQPDARELMDQALAFEPDFFAYYRNYSIYVLPQWHGNPGDIQALAEEAASKYPEPQGSMLYSRIMSTLACYCGQKPEELRAADWQKLKLGFANIEKVYGLADINANRFAEMAFVFGDKAVAREAFIRITQRDDDIWVAEKYFQCAKDWANTP